MHAGKSFQPPLDVSQVMGCKHRIVSDISTPNFGQSTRVKFRYFEIPKYNMQLCRYKLENNTLNSVLDCVSNKTNIPERYVERSRSYIRRKVWLSDALFTFFDYIVYSMVWLVYIVRVCLVYY